MNTFLRFFYEFISIFFDGIVMMFKGIVNGIAKIFNFKNYGLVINSYKEAFGGAEWIFVAISIIILLIIVGLIGLLIYFFIRKTIMLRKNKLNQEELLAEIADLNEQVVKLMKEKDEIMAMKVSQLGLKPGEEESEETTSENSEEENPEGEVNLDLEKVRFPKLCAVDMRMVGFKPKNYANNFTLKELIDNFQCFAASRLHLYYTPTILRPFFAGLACGKLVILQGISGTGKTSLAYAWGKFVNCDSCVASVQPSWRDRTELLGYFNEFTKKFSETKVLEELYTATFDDDVHTIILDEMNIARVEYYFAELLSILEMPSKDEWIIDIVPNQWPDDPKKLVRGKLKLPGNLWYIGTINNDDSTFMVTDKVYDRAMPIDINEKTPAFECRDQEPMNINASYLENLFKETIDSNPISDKNIDKVNKMDDYVIEHFRISFGNRIMKQMNTFVPIYVACGGTEEAGIDYFVAKKILRKFEQLNTALIYDEIDPFIAYLNKEFGDGIMVECIGYLVRLKKSI